ncbi:MAG TPA: alpha/beta hydrolase [Mesorhizobium sp.]|uniref:alpha/beta fold hydrolase n=1 Tax=Mesorhizobium sp. TaxID=1871066 RepID=UPI002DDD5EA6|nr:alpha/beta hydrolase [Mesorhizobium sp.]HEV2506700.1 alpha/beta hydrolase [Mesorhizobium sp.]
MGKLDLCDLDLAHWLYRETEEFSPSQSSSSMFVTVNGTKLFFDVEGAGLVPDGPRMKAKPTLLLLHGGPGFDHSLLKPAFSSFADIAQVIYLDQRGSGRSAQSPSETWNLAQWGDDVRSFCDVLGIAKPIVFGVSFGGFVAQSYATRHPGHPGKLILCNTAAQMDFSVVFDIFAHFGGAEAGAIARAYWQDPTVANWERYAAICLPLYNRRPAGDDDWKKRAVVAKEVGVHFNGPGNEHGAMDFRSALKTITCPTLVLAGDKDPITPLSFGTTIADCLRPEIVRFEKFVGCGHPVFVDDPIRVFELIRKFILQMDAR